MPQIMHEKLNWKGRVINSLSLYRTYYDQGIRVLAVIRNMEITDLGILMGVCKYLFGDAISTSTIVLMGAGYWIFNAMVNVTVGRFWEKNGGWQIEAKVLGQRTVVSRVVLVSPEGHPYDARNVTFGVSGCGHSVSSDWPDGAKREKEKKPCEES